MGKSVFGRRTVADQSELVSGMGPSYQFFDTILPMDTFIAVCLALIVVELGVMIAVFAFAMVKVRDAAQAVEVAAYRVDQEVLTFGESMRSGWMTALKGAISVGLNLFR
jgi:hypothetical protein